MIQFVQWLSEKLKVTPSEAVQILNEAPEEEVKKYTDLFLAETTQETGKFKSGGKINAAVTKFQNGGNLTRRQALNAFMENKGGTRAQARKALRSAKLGFDNNNMTGDRNQWARSVIAGQDYIPQENTNVYDRVGARESKKAIGGYDTNGHILNRGDQNVLMKKAKAANVEGFNENMYNFDPNQEFDRQNYRDRKRYAKENFDYMTRRQRKAYALMDHRVNPVSTQQIITPDPTDQVNVIPTSVTKVIGERTPINIEGIPAPSNFENYTRRAEKVRRDLKYNPVSFDQFAGLLDDSMLVSDAFRNGMNSRAFQVHRANEYLRYKNDPLNYIYRQMDANYGKSAQMLDDEKRARQMGILANNRGTGYYDPNDKSFESVSLFKDKTAQQMWDESGAGKEYTRYYWTDSKGNRLTDEQAQALDMMQEARGYTVPTSETAPKIGQASGNAVKINQVPESTWHKPLAYAGMAALSVPAISMISGAINQIPRPKLGTTREINLSKPSGFDPWSYGQNAGNYGSSPLNGNAGWFKYAGPEYWFKNGGKLK